MYNLVVAKRKNFTFRLDPDVVFTFQKFAETDHRSLNNMVEVTMMEALRAKGIEIEKAPDVQDETN